jgi:hypothetical protein
LRHDPFREAGGFCQRLRTRDARPPTIKTIKTLALLAALLAYAAGFVILYPVVASSVAESVAQGNDPALMQFVGP